MSACLACGGYNVRFSDKGLAPFVAYRALGVDTPLNAGKSACADCGFASSVLRPSDEQMARLYDGYRGEEYNKQRISYEPSYAAIAHTLNGRREYMPEVETFIEQFVTPKNVLDYGGNDGGNAPFVGRCNIDNYEIGMALPAGDYDLVAIMHVLEHVSSPEQILKQVADTYPAMIYVEVPLSQGIIWHEHINEFTARSLSKLVMRCGYNILAVRNIRSDIECFHSNICLVAGNAA